MQDMCDALLQRLDVLESQNERLDAFARAMADQLKGPLCHIAGYAGFLCDVHPALPATRLRESLSMMRYQAKKALALLDELQLLVGAEQGGMPANGREGEGALEGRVLAGSLYALEQASR